MLQATLLRIHIHTSTHTGPDLDGYAWPVAWALVMCSQLCKYSCRQTNHPTYRHLNISKFNTLSASKLITCNDFCTTDNSQGAWEPNHYQGFTMSSNILLDLNDIPTICFRFQYLPTTIPRQVCVFGFNKGQVLFERASATAGVRLGFGAAAPPPPPTLQPLISRVRLSINRVMPSID